MKQIKIFSALVCVISMITSFGSYADQNIMQDSKKIDIQIINQTNTIISGVYTINTTNLTPNNLVATILPGENEIIFHTINPDPSIISSVTLGNSHPNNENGFEINAA